MNVCGLDTASNRWHAVVMDEDGTHPHTFEFLTKESNVDVRRHELYNEARSFFSSLSLLSPNTQIFCEEPLALKNGKTTRVLGLACGAIWAAHLSFNLTWHWVDVAAWKKSIVGKGSASKDEVRAVSLERGGLEGWEEDHYDAHCIGLHGARELAVLADPA